MEDSNVNHVINSWLYCLFAKVARVLFSCFRRNVYKHVVVYLISINASFIYTSPRSKHLRISTRLLNGVMQSWKCCTCSGRATLNVMRLQTMYLQIVAIPAINLIRGIESYEKEWMLYSYKWCNQLQPIIGFKLSLLDFRTYVLDHYYQDTIYFSHAYNAKKSTCIHRCPAFCPLYHATKMLLYRYLYQTYRRYQHFSALFTTCKSNQHQAISTKKYISGECFPLKCHSQEAIKWKGKQTPVTDFSKMGIL